MEESTAILQKLHGFHRSVIEKSFIYLQKEALGDSKLHAFSFNLIRHVLGDVGYSSPYLYT